MGMRSYLIETVRGYWTHLYPALPASAPLVRADVESLLRPLFEPDELGLLLLAVGEAVANAVRHGKGPLQAHVEVSEHNVVVRVRDGGSGFDSRRLYEAEPSPLDAESGRGLYVIKRAADQVIVTVDHGTVVAITHRRRRNGGSSPHSRATSPPQAGSSVPHQILDRPSQRLL